MNSIESTAVDIRTAMAAFPVIEMQESKASLLRAWEIMGGLAVENNELGSTRRACLDALHSVECISTAFSAAHEQLNAYLADIGTDSVAPRHNPFAAFAGQLSPEYTVSPQERRNRELLARSELGPVLLAAYDLAIAADSRLSEVEVVPLPLESHHVAAAQPAWKSPTGRHRINIRLSDIESTLHLYDATLSKIPGGRRYFADMLGIEEGQITPTVLYIHSVLHELGHVPEYIDYADRPARLRAEQVAEKEAMPAGRMPVSRLLVLSDAERRHVEERLADLPRNPGISTFDELVARQFVAYRNLTSEKRADDFANAILRANPSFLGQVVGHRTPPLR